MALARETVDELGVTSVMAIDSMDNAIGRAYGGLPNSAYIIGQDGRVFVKQPWVNAKRLRAPLEALLATGGSGGEKPPVFDTGAGGPGRRRFRDRDRSPSRPLAEFKDAPVDGVKRGDREIAWRHDLEQARRIARQADVPLLVEFYFDSCAYCAAMAKGPLRDPAVLDVARKFVCVKLNLENPEVAKLADQLDLVGSPAFAVYNPKNEIILRHTSYADADFMAQRLREGLEKSYENAAEDIER